MKKTIIISIIIIAILLSGIIVYNAIYPGKVIKMEPELVGEYEGDFSILAKELRMKEGVVFLEEYSNAELLKDVLQQLNIPLPNIDFSRKNCVISFGGRLLQVQYGDYTTEGYLKEQIFELDFDYQENKIFIYSIDKIEYVLGS